MSQTIMYPEHCLGCKAERMGIQEGVAYYKCGTAIRVIWLTGKLQVFKSEKCSEGEIHGKQHQTGSIPQP